MEMLETQQKALLEFKCRQEDALNSRAAQPGRSSTTACTAVQGISSSERLCPQLCSTRANICKEKAFTNNPNLIWGCRLSAFTHNHTSQQAGGVFQGSVLFTGWLGGCPVPQPHPLGSQELAVVTPGICLSSAASPTPGTAQEQLSEDPDSTNLQDAISR